MAILGYLRGCSIVFGVALLVGWSVAPESARKRAGWPADDAGLINGTVLYPNGEPVDAATVYAGPFGRPIGLAFPRVQTNQAGEFAIRIPPSWFGRNFVAAEKVDEDYPDMGNQFYANGKFHVVTLTARHPATTVTIRLGPKAGVLTGTVTDAITGSALNPCTALQYAASTNFLAGTGLVMAKYRLLLPSNTGIFMKVALDGYSPWYYPSTAMKSAAKPIRLGPAEERTINIRLKPDSRHARLGCAPPLFVR